jgi:hypothetical protein
MVEKDLLIDKEKGGRKPMKKKYSTLLNFALAACVATSLAACSGDDSLSTSTSTSVTGPTIGHAENPKVSIGGSVFDTNGNPLANVTVSCEGTQSTTNSSGQYVIHNLQVHNVSGSRESNSNADDYGEGLDIPVRCVINAPTGYLGAQVYVYPEAQVVNTLYDNTSAELTNTNQPLLWFDGMYAEAATAWLPMLGSTVTGRLENCTTEESVALATVKLDMVGVDNNGIAGQAEAYLDSCGSGCDLNWATAMYSATTGADGTFTIANVPNDTILRMYAEGYSYIETTVKSQVGTVKKSVVEGKKSSPTGATPASTSKSAVYVTTVNEGLVYLGDVCVNNIPSGDSVRPCVANIGGWVIPAGLDPDGNGYVTVDTPWSDDELELAVLHDNIDGTTGIDIIFNESLQASEINQNSVVVWDMDDEEYITAFSTSFAGKTLTLTTTNPIPDGHHILVYLLRDDSETWQAISSMLMICQAIPVIMCVLPRNFIPLTERVMSLSGSESSLRMTPM